MQSKEPMKAEQRMEVVECVQNNVDKFEGKWEQCARGIKESLDKKFGHHWHVCVGEGFGYRVTFQAQNMLMLYYRNCGVLCFKC